MNNHTCFDLPWFQKHIEPLISGQYRIRYRFFEEGDLGSLNQVIIESAKTGGNIDFWGLDWLGVFIYSYDKEEIIMNVLVPPEEENEKKQIFNKLLSLL